MLEGLTLTVLQNSTVRDLPAAGGAIIDYSWLYSYRIDHNMNVDDKRDESRKTRLQGRHGCKEDTDVVVVAMD